MDVQEGDIVKAIGNHCYKGHEGVVDHIEEVDGVEYSHVLLENGSKIIMRPGQYKLLRRADKRPSVPTDHLTSEVLPHIRRVAHNQRYTIAVRRKALENLQMEIQTMLTLLDYEEQQNQDKATAEQSDD